MKLSLFMYGLVLLLSGISFAEIVAQQTPFFPGREFTRVHYYKLRAGFEPPKAENGILLSPEQVNTLMTVLSDTASYIEPVFKCYDPNDVFIFYNDKNRITGRLDLAFKCKKILPDPAIPIAHKKGNGLSVQALDTLEILLASFAEDLKNTAPEEISQLTHIVAEGDKWDIIAKNYNTTIDLIAAVNKKNTQWTPTPGDELIIYQNYPYFKYPELKKEYMKSDFSALIAGESPKKTEEPSGIKENPGKAEDKKPATSDSKPSSGTAKPQDIPGKGNEISTPPADNNTEQSHVVKSGETLYSISRKYSIAVDAIKKANQMKDNAIKIGQKLIIPKI
ncbi:MAG: LysM peptidoglycan-binding domain-containing protein [Bacteroidia bacterium]|nr:LysM peptidoglycan-binding domain-containing protein [Bacteroidia bacterium]